MEETFLDGRLVVKVGDLTEEDVDAIVNAANWTLMGGGGVDGAIHRAGGPAILEACREIRRTQYPKGLPAGQVVVTTAGELPARHVIHTVGPIWERDPEPEGLLASCYRRSIELGHSLGLTGIAFPAISTGAYGYPKHLAAAVASRAIVDTLVSATSISQIILVFSTGDDAAVFARHHRFPPLA